MKPPALKPGEAACIRKIAARASAMARDMGATLDPADVLIDLAICHVETPLHLGQLYAAPDIDFSHDVFGIRENLCRDSGRLRGGFYPRAASMLQR